MRDHTKLRAFELADEIAFELCKECHYQFTLAVRLGYTADIDISFYENKFTETEKVIAALIRSLRKP